VSRRWPDLQLRAEIAASRKAEAEESQARGPAAQTFGEVLQKLLEKVVAETVGGDPGMTEDAYVAHLKDCAPCRKNVASFARMGVKIPSKILVAAGVEVLN
jgi:hypothetical protein